MNTETAMRYVDEYRDPDKARALLSAINELLPEIMKTRDKPLQIMEVCGGHTHAIFKHGLHELLPDDIEFVHGPGCPVCVLPMGRVDDCLSLATRPEVIFTTYGDAMRVPGSKGSLLQARAAGADVRMVYSPLDALALARDNSDREVVFFALGFETTMPATALTVLEAKQQGITNFTVFCNHITIVSTIKAILDSPGMRLDGFLGPGHTAMVIGTEVFGFVPERYGLPFVVSGFEPVDVLQSVWQVLQQIHAGKPSVENQYARVVDERGNTPALEALFEVFELREFFEWRGLGSIDHSGVRLTKEFADFDAEKRFAVPDIRIADPKACQCGEVLKGVIKPTECKVFGKGCTPQTPMGALMVSSEGACAAYFNYGSSRLRESKVSSQPLEDMRSSV
jgi:hydrogenase expression/formation protein HypD